jgi:hypothetical protein
MSVETWKEVSATCASRILCASPAAQRGWQGKAEGSHRVSHLRSPLSTRQYLHIRIFGGTDKNGTVSPDGEFDTLQGIVRIGSIDRLLQPPHIQRK